MRSFTANLVASVAVLAMPATAQAARPWFGTWSAHGRVVRTTGVRLTVTPTSTACATPRTIR